MSVVGSASLPVFVPLYCITASFQAGVSRVSIYITQGQPGLYPSCIIHPTHAIHLQHSSLLCFRVHTLVEHYHPRLPPHTLPPPVLDTCMHTFPPRKRTEDGHCVRRRRHSVIVDAAWTLPAGKSRPGAVPCSSRSRFPRPQLCLAVGSAQRGSHDRTWFV